MVKRAFDTQETDRRNIASITRCDQTDLHDAAVVIFILR